MELENNNSVMVRKQIQYLIELIERVSNEVAKRRKGKKLSLDSHAIYEQYDKRAKRAGL